jgi:hypothetical protein
LRKLRYRKPFFIGLDHPIGRIMVFSSSSQKQSFAQTVCQPPENTLMQPPKINMLAETMIRAFLFIKAFG